MSKENVDFVRCRECGFEGKMLNRHLAKHGLTATEYSGKYPNALMSIPSIRKAQAQKVSGPKGPPRELVCPHCGGEFNNREVLWKHLKMEKDRFILGTEGMDYVVCQVCGMRGTQLQRHIEAHHLSASQYHDRFPNAFLVADLLSQGRAKKLRAKGGYKPISEKRGAKQCTVCSEWYQPETAKQHRQECVQKHPKSYQKGVDYVACPECSLPFLRLGRHLRQVHGWSEDKLALEKNRGLQLTASSVRDKWAAKQDFAAIQKKREATHLARHGHANPFASLGVQKKLVETSRRRYGVDHPMKDEEVFIRNQEANGVRPTRLEWFFDQHTPETVVYSGYGARFIRTKVGVRKLGRMFKDLNPDFMVFTPMVAARAQVLSAEEAIS